MNWGKSIVLVYILFVAGILFLVYKSSQTKLNLVSTDYYQKEIKYQDEIDAKDRAAKSNLLLVVSVMNDSLCLKIPTDKGGVASGIVEFYCPQFPENDCNFTLTSNETGEWKFPKKKLANGRYEVTAKWENKSGEAFQSEIDFQN